MPKIIRKLTETEVRNAPAKEKPYKLYDEGGLRLLVRPSGTKTWQVPYTYRNKANIFTIGQYSHIERAGTYKMTEARKIRDEVKACVARGENPKTMSANVSFAKHSGCNGTLLDNSAFEVIAREWHGKGVWVPKHSKSILRSLERDVFPLIGHKKIKSIKATDIVGILEQVERRGALDVAHRVTQRCATIFEYAIRKGLCDSNPALGRAKLVQKNEVKHRPHLKEYQLPPFLKALDAYHGREYIKLGTMILMRTLVRPSELRLARWEEVDFDKAQWSVPAQRMKMRKAHIVPLSKQTVALVSNLKSITGNNGYMFPSIKTAHKPISDVTFTKVLRILDFRNDDGDVIVPHGFRHTASTILNEHRFDRDVIERQLAHKDKDKIRGTYNHAEYLSERTEMMQWYSDHLDGLME